MAPSTGAQRCENAQKAKRVMSQRLQLELADLTRAPVRAMVGGAQREGRPFEGGEVREF